MQRKRATDHAPTPCDRPVAAARGVLARRCRRRRHGRARRPTPVVCICSAEGTRCSSTQTCSLGGAAARRTTTIAAGCWLSEECEECEDFVWWFGSVMGVCTVGGFMFHFLFLGSVLLLLKANGPCSHRSFISLISLLLRPAAVEGGHVTLRGRRPRAWCRLHVKRVLASLQPEPATAWPLTPPRPE